jgi:hypothetical protein
MIDAPMGRFYQFCNNLHIGEEMKSILIDLIGCKYRPNAKLLQHKEARIVVASALRHSEKNTQVIKDRAESVRAKLATDTVLLPPRA